MMTFVKIGVAALMLCVGLVGESNASGKEQEKKDELQVVVQGGKRFKVIPEGASEAFIRG